MASKKHSAAPFSTFNGKAFRVLIERFGFKARKGSIPTLDEAITWRDEQLKLAPKPHSKKPVRERSHRRAFTVA